MPESSPWYQLYKFAPPYFPYCGDFNANWVLDPIDTYSSFFHTIAALVIFYQGKHSPKVLRQLAWIPLIITIGSILFHMSFTYAFLIADFMGIFFLNFYGINLNFARLRKVDKEKVFRLSLGLSVIYGLMMALTYKARVHTGLLMIPILFILLQSEWRCFKKNKEANYKHYFIAVGLTALGYVAMLLEGPPFRLGCVEGALKGKLQLHLIWHLLSATSIVFIFKFYNQKALRKDFL